MEAKPYKIAGIPVTCAHCDPSDFFKQDSEFMGEALAGLLYLRKAAVTYICASCGHLM